MPYISRIFILSSFVAGCLFAQTAMAGTQEQVKIFSLLKADTQPKPGLPGLNDPLVYGVSWRFKWQTLEPQENHYNWQLVDEALALTSQAGKKVMLRMISGVSTPEWVYEAGAKTLDFSNREVMAPQSHPERMRMPVPWDEVYLAKWESFIGALGKRYNGNPHIYSVVIAGGGHFDEMNLPKVYEQWQQLGYADDKLIRAWKRIIDAYQRALPSIPTNLSINEPLGNRSHVLNPIVAYVLATYPGKVYLQQNALRADFPRAGPIRSIIRDASTRTIVGYQMLGGKGFLEQQTGDRATAFRIALEDHVSYVEIYAADVRDPGLREALQFLTGRLERR